MEGEQPLQIGLLQREDLEYLKQGGLQDTALGEKFVENSPLNFARRKLSQKSFLPQISQIFFKDFNIKICEICGK